jgi:hypothetical protein
MRTRRAPNARAFYLASETENFVIALRLMGSALVSLDNELGRGILAAAWEASKRLDRLKKILD